MFVPVHDENKLKSIRFQYVTLALVVINVVVYVLEIADVVTAPAIASLALVPFELLQQYIPAPGIDVTGADFGFIPEPATLLTYMFLHASWLHLIGNMLFLWVFGDNVEDALGHVRFLAFYLLCGIAAGLVHAFAVNMSGAIIDPEIAREIGATEPIPVSHAPLLGASGAVAGVIAAYLMLHPKVMVWVLALKVIPLRIYAFYALGAWILMQLVMVMLPQSGPVAWWAHIGGLVTGAILVIALRRPGVPLFDKGLAAAR
jgi:membrane associated rhomboid family serine protease